jgi:hypothetical protein
MADGRRISNLAKKKSGANFKCEFAPDLGTDELVV